VRVQPTILQQESEVLKMNYQMSSALAQGDMTPVILKGKTEFMGIEIPVIEGGFGEDEKVVLAKTVAEIHDMELKKVNELIKNNTDEFEAGIDIIDLKYNEAFAVVAKDSGIYTQNALNASQNIYLLSEQGYMALVGLMKTEKAKELRKKFRREYFSMRQAIKQKPMCIEDILIAQLQDMKAVKEQLTQVNNTAIEAKQEVQAIRDTMVLDPAAWRTETSNLINKIAQKFGGNENIQAVRNESYELLESRARARLKVKQTNMRRKVLEETGSTSKANKISKLDVIASEARLREIYIAIVKEMAIKYGVA
jgi:phage regulator Rha-like protein